MFLEKADGRPRSMMRHTGSLEAPLPCVSPLVSSTSSLRSITGVERLGDDEALSRWLPAQEGLSAGSRKGVGRPRLP